ncbi:hypothetical protein AbraIFM66950_011808 [Aspergillus brasiliensis]|nr:hypothetical protein AbraIFM66950_011808 [Aspergillus brasiliensis]
MDVDKEHPTNHLASTCKMLETLSDKDTAIHQGTPGLFDDTFAFDNWYESTTGPYGKSGRDTPSPTRPEKNSLVILNEKSLSERNSRGPVEKPAWKPPRPPKPRFLSRVDVAGSETYENATPCPMPASRDGPVDHKWLAPRAQLSTPLGCSRSRIRLANRAIFLQGTDTDISKRQKGPWSDPKLGLSRYLSRPAKRETKSHLIKNDLSGSFPVPLPSIDGLPLRHDLRIVKPRTANIYAQNRSDTLESHQEVQESSLKRIINWFGKLLSWDLHLLKPKERSVVSMSFVGQRSLQHAHSGFTSYEFSVSINWPNTSGSIEIRQGQVINLPASPNKATRLFRADITLPHFATRILVSFCTVFRSLMSKEVVAIFVQLFMRFVGLPVLYVLKRFSINLTIHQRESATT